MTAARVNNESSGPSEIGRGVGKNCLISLLLFDVYAEAMTKLALNGVDNDSRIGDALMQPVWFVDDQAVINNTKEGLLSIMDETKSSQEL